MIYCLKTLPAVNKKIGQCNRTGWWRIIIGVFEAVEDMAITVGY